MEAENVLLETVKTGIEEVIDQPQTSKVNVQRWYPGVVQCIRERVDEKGRVNLSQRLLNEATSILERKQEIQTSATRQKSIAELTGGGNGNPQKALGEETVVDETQQGRDALHKKEEQEGEKTESKPRRRRVRQKMRSTPVVGGGLFGERIEAVSGREVNIVANQGLSDKNHPWSLGDIQRGLPAEITVNGQRFNIRISQETMHKLQNGCDGSVDSRGIGTSAIDIGVGEGHAPITHRLQGFVRKQPLTQIDEDTVDFDSQVDSEDPSVYDVRL